MTGAELFVACLEVAGVEIIYGLPGEENTDLMLALDQSSIEFVLTRHEQSAAFMASVYGRLTGRPAGCLATLGPGATNLMTGVADAHLDFAPLIAITGQGATGRIAMSESHQVMDLTALFEPITKRSQTLMSATEIPGVVAEAVRLSLAPRPGAVHLSLPEDVAAMTVKRAPIVAPPASIPQPAKDASDRAAGSIAQASAPLVLAGAGVVRSSTAAQVVSFAEHHNLPLATTFMGNGVLPPDHDLFLGTFGQPFDDHIDKALHHADLVVAIGFDPIEVSPCRLADEGAPTVVHIDEVAAMIDVGWTVKADVMGDIAATLQAISIRLGERKWSVPDAVREVQERLRSERVHTPETQGGKFKPEDALAMIEDDLQNDDIILSGVGTHKLKVARSLRAKRAGQAIIANGSAGMGIALPGAIAATALQSKGRTLAICGDGEFLMNLQEMETAARLEAPLTVVLWEDGGYGLIEEKQQSAKGAHTDLSFGNPDWAHLCTAFKWTHAPVETVQELRTSLRDSRHAEGPTLITLKVDYSDGLKPSA